MSFIDKVKKAFFGETQSTIPVEGTEIPLESTIMQPKGDIVGQCVVCSLAIGSEDRTRQIRDVKVHKRCAKKMMRGLMAGKNMGELINGQ